MKGYCTELLRSIADINANNSAEKMRIAGFLAMLFCCANSTVSPVNDGNRSDGHRQDLRIKYRRRPTEDDVDSDDNCEINRIPAWEEWTIPALGFKKTSWFVSDDEIRKYCSEASQFRSVGGDTPQIMQDHYISFLEAANVLMSAINRDLVTQAAPKFGVNVTTGSSTGKVININRDGDKMILDNGIIEMMRDLQENEFCGTPCIVGGGLYSAWRMAIEAACCNSAGINLQQLGVPEFFFDKATQSIWGENTVGVFSPGSVKFLGFNKFVGNFRGQRGTSFFSTVPMPVNAFGCNADACLRDLVFDFQMKFIDCPTTIAVGPDDTPTLVNRGWQFILSKEYALWTQPDDEYPEGDELEGTNGMLKYFLSNVSGDPSAYAYPI